LANETLNSNTRAQKDLTTAQEGQEALSTAKTRTQVESKKRERSAYDQLYYQKNREAKLEYHREYYNNKKEARREYYKINYKKKRDTRHLYYQKNREKILEYRHEYGKKTRERKRRYDRDLRSRKKEASGLPPPRKYSSWNSGEVRNFCEKFSDLHFIKSWPDDWYRISQKQMKAAGGISVSLFPSSLHPSSSLSLPSLPLSLSPLSSIPHLLTITGRYMLMKYKTLGNALKAGFPEFEWELNHFSRKGKKSIQRWYLMRRKEKGERSEKEERRNEGRKKE
jgi:hypothetical protein